MLKRDKPKEVEKLKELISQYKVIGLLNMHKLPARQLGQIKNSISDVAKIRMSKKILISKVLKESGKANIDKLVEKIKDEPALLLSNENPFKVFSTLKNNRSKASAKAGDKAMIDIVVPKGPTELPPGPAISTLQKIKLKASVQGGKITVIDDKTVCKPGDVVTSDIADVLSLLKIEPMEIGLDLVAAWEDGMVYDRDILDVSVEDYIRDMENAVHQAVNLSVNVGYPTGLTIKLMLQKAFNEARALCTDAGILEKDFIDDILLKAIREAKSLEGGK